jgi:hypothetical protein
VRFSGWSERVQEIGEGPTLAGVLAAAAEARETLVELQVSVANRISEAASDLASASAALAANKHEPAALVQRPVLQHVLGRYVRELDTIRRVLAPPSDK